MVSPAVLIVAGIVSGVDGLLSAAIGLVLVSLNFLASARLITYTARRSPGAVMGVVLGGYIVRLGLLFGIAFALDTVSWIDIGVLLLTIAVVHLSLLTWETRHVSLTLAYPGLKPGKQ
jgi:cytochrome c biogenesis factor